MGQGGAGAGTPGVACGRRGRPARGEAWAYWWRCWWHAKIGRCRRGDSGQGNGGEANADCMRGWGRLMACIGAIRGKAGAGPDRSGMALGAAGHGLRVDFRDFGPVLRVPRPPRPKTTRVPAGDGEDTNRDGTVHARGRKRPNLFRDARMPSSQRTGRRQAKELAQGEGILDGSALCVVIEVDMNFEPLFDPGDHAVSPDLQTRP